MGRGAAGLRGGSGAPRALPSLCWVKAERSRQREHRCMRHGRQSPARTGAPAPPHAGAVGPRRRAGHRAVTSRLSLSLPCLRGEVPAVPLGPGVPCRAVPWVPPVRRSGAKQEARGVPRAGCSSAPLPRPQFPFWHRYKGGAVRESPAAVRGSQDGSAGPGGGLRGAGFVPGTRRGHQPWLRGEDHPGGLGLRWVRRWMSRLAGVLVAEARSGALARGVWGPGAGWGEPQPWVPNAPICPLPRAAPAEAQGCPALWGSWGAAARRWQGGRRAGRAGGSRCRGTCPGSRAVSLEERATEERRRGAAGGQRQRWMGPTLVLLRRAEPRLQQSAVMDGNHCVRNSSFNLAALPAARERT